MQRLLLNASSFGGRLPPPVVKGGERDVPSLSSSTIPASAANHCHLWSEQTNAASPCFLPQRFQLRRPTTTTCGQRRRIRRPLAFSLDTSSFGGQLQPPVVRGGERGPSSPSSSTLPVSVANHCHILSEETNAALFAAPGFGGQPPLSVVRTGTRRLLAFALDAPSFGGCSNPFSPAPCNYEAPWFPPVACSLQSTVDYSPNNNILCTYITEVRLV